MNKVQLFILFLLFGCVSHSIAQTTEKHTEQTETTSSQTDEEEYDDEEEYVEDEESTIQNDSIANARLFDYNAALIEQLKAKKAYTVDTDTTLVNKKFVAGFKKKYLSDDAFNYEENQSKSAWQTFKEWLQKVLDNFFRQFKTDHKTTKDIYNILEIGGYLVVVAFIYFLVRAYLQKDLQWFFRRKPKGVVIEIDEIEKNLDKVNFPILIEETEQTKNYRLIIRYYYLWLLQQLQEKGHIKWHLEKTNSDYLREITNATVKADFEYLSYIYNNIWYGEHSIGIEEYSKAKTSFETIIKPRNNE
ncbi:MAG: DUF4129 domain-containing protein [Flavobacteriaceae bacterium]|jgi:hypothetical protein|nr:DUF4129 domain-containing protein [Flavobacteriaceae bacterium]